MPKRSRRTARIALAFEPGRRFVVDGLCKFIGRLLGWHKESCWCRECWERKARDFKRGMDDAERYLNARR